MDIIKIKENKLKTILQFSIPSNMPEEWCKFIKKYEHLASSDTIYMESTFDDPSITDVDSCM